MDRDYDRDFADPLQVPAEPMGWWGLSRRSRPWARDENGWGTSERTRERDMARRDQWRGTGAWGAGRAEPGIWGREREPPRPRRHWYDGDMRHSEPGGRSRDRGIEWNGWGYEVGRGRGPGQRGRPGRTSSDEWGRYRSGGGGQGGPGAWSYGRQRQSMFEATGQAARRGWGRMRAGRPDLREGEAWNEAGPGGWGSERRPGPGQGYAGDWNRDFYNGSEGWARTAPWGARRGQRGMRRARYDQQYGADYRPRGRPGRDRSDYGW